MLEFLYRADPPERPAPPATIPDHTLRTWAERAVDDRGKPLTTAKGKPITPENTWGFMKVNFEGPSRVALEDLEVVVAAKAASEKEFDLLAKARMAAAKQPSVPGPKRPPSAGSVIKPKGLTKFEKQQLAAQKAREAEEARILAELEAEAVVEPLTEENVEEKIEQQTAKEIARINAIPQDEWTKEDAMYLLIREERAEEPDADRIELLERKAIGVTGRQVNAYMALLAGGGEEDHGSNTAVLFYLNGDADTANLHILEARLDGAKLMKSSNVRSLAAKLGALKKRLGKEKN